MSVTILATRGDDGPLIQAGVDELPALRADESVHLWVHIASGDASAKALLEETFGLHPLLVEDALKTQDIPKLEAHEGYAYFIVHAPVPGDYRLAEAETGDLDLFLGDRFLVTHHYENMPDVDKVRAQLEHDPAPLRDGPATVAHRLVDTMIDRFVLRVQSFADELEALEIQVLRENKPTLLEEIFDTKQSVQRMARTVRHMRDVLGILASGRLGLVPDDVRPFFRDVLDHCVRVADGLEAHRDVISDALDAYLSMQSHRLNEVMKMLTLISTIMLPLTFITGLYGMNFDHMPGLHHRFGYEVAWGVMLLTALLIYLYFKRKRWL